MLGLRERQEEQARRFAEFVERDPNPVFEADREGRITYENAAAKAYWSDLAAKGSQHPLLADWAHLVATLDHEPSKAIERVVPVSAAFFEERLHLSGDRQHVRVHAVDVTRRVREEEVTRRFEVIANRVPEFMTLIGPDYVYKAANDAYCQAHKMRREALLGKTMAQVWGEQIFKTVLQAHVDRCLTGEEVAHQLWVDFPSTGRRHVEVAYYPDRDDQGVVRHVVVMTRDVTRVIEAEQDLRRRETREFLARMAENVVKGIGHGVGHATTNIPALAEHLKTYFEPPMGAPVEITVTELMSRIVVRPSEKELQAVKVSQEVGPSAPVHVRADRVERALAILYARALRSAARAKGVSPRVTVEAWQEGLCRIAVTDNGPGLTEPELAGAFDPTGGDFSLAAVRNLVEGEGGVVEVHNAPGRGTQFAIAFPPVAGAAGEVTRAERTAGGKARIVVIDDDAAVASMVRNTFAGVHEVMGFLSGREALAYLERVPVVDLILCDLMMPGMSGMDVHASVAARWPDYARRMVFLSGGLSSPQADRFLAMTPVKRIGKPLGSASLQKFVKEFLAEAG